MKNIARKALVNGWIKEIESKKYNKSQLISLAANLCVDLSRYQKLTPTLPEQLKRDNTLKRLIPSLGGQGKSNANKLKQKYIQQVWLTWHKEGKIIGRYKSSFYRHLEKLFTDSLIASKYGELYDDKTVKKLCKEWERKFNVALLAR